MQGFPNSAKWWDGGKFPPVGGSQKFYCGEIFLLYEGNLRGSDFDD